MMHYTCIKRAILLVIVTTEILDQVLVLFKERINIFWTGNVNRHETLGLAGFAHDHVRGHNIAVV